MIHVLETSDAADSSLRTRQQGGENLTRAFTFQPQNAALCCNVATAMGRLTQDAKGTFAYLSNEYARALQTFDALERQASTLMAVGNAEELCVFIDQFVLAATRLRDHAVEHDEPHFAEWFGELIAGAEALGHQAASEK